MHATLFSTGWIKNNIKPHPAFIPKPVLLSKHIVFYMPILLTAVSMH